MRLLAQALYLAHLYCCTDGLYISLTCNVGPGANLALGKVWWVHEFWPISPMNKLQASKIVVDGWQTEERVNYRNLCSNRSQKFGNTNRSFQQQIWIFMSVRNIKINKFNLHLFWCISFFSMNQRKQQKIQIQNYVIHHNGISIWKKLFVRIEFSKKKKRDFSFFFLIMNNVILSQIDLQTIWSVESFYNFVAT